MELLSFNDICGYLVEHFSGMKLDKYFQKHIFDPLGMEDTGFSCAKEKVDRLASLYEQHPKKGPVLVDPGGAKTARVKKRKCFQVEEGYYPLCQIIIVFVLCY